MQKFVESSNPRILQSFRYESLKTFPQEFSVELLEQSLKKSLGNFFKFKVRILEGISARFSEDTTGRIYERIFEWKFWRNPGRHFRWIFLNEFLEKSSELVPDGVSERPWKPTEKNDLDETSGEIIEKKNPWDFLKESMEGFLKKPLEKFLKYLRRFAEESHKEFLIQSPGKFL